MGDAELLRMKAILNNELEAKLMQMKLDPEIQVLYSQLDDIDDEQKERGL